MQLEVKFQEIKPVESNFEKLKVELKERLEKYQSIVVVEDEIPLYKQDRANLNKLKKALNDEKIRIKREFSAPITAFECQVKELIEMINSPIDCIDDRLKKFEEKRKQEKKEKIEAIFLELSDIDQIKLSMVYQETWLNSSVSMKKIKDEISAFIEKIHAEIQAITDLGSDHEPELQELYLKTFDLTKVLAKKAEIDRIIEAEKARKEAEEERKRKEKEAAEKAQKEAEERKAREAQEQKENEAKAEIDRLKAELEAKKKEEADQFLVKHLDKEQEKKSRVYNPGPAVQKPAVKAEPEIEQIDFRIWVTKEQKIAVRNFLVDQNIKYGGVN